MAGIGLLYRIDRQKPYGVDTALIKPITTHGWFLWFIG
jgi:hypothetical protein